MHLDLRIDDDRGIAAPGELGREREPDRPRARDQDGDERGYLMPALAAASFTIDSSE